MQDLRDLWDGIILEKINIEKQHKHLKKQQKLTSIILTHGLL